MDKTIDFSQRSKKYRAKYLENSYKLCNPKPKDDQGSTIFKESSRKHGKNKNETLVKFKDSKKEHQPKAPREDLGQIALVDWMTYMGLFFHSIPNQGKRTPWGHQKQFAMGMHKGASDLFLGESRGPYNGFYIEMKRKGERPTSDQFEFMLKARKRGFKAEWYDDWLAAKADIEDYLGLTKPAA